MDAYSARPGVFRVVTVPPIQYLMVDGHGDPNTSAGYTAAIEAIYPVAYKLKFASKNDGRDYAVMPLEALWWSDDMAAFTSARDKSRWDWTLLNMVPDWVTSDDFDQAVAAVRARGAPDALGRVRLATLDEGLAVQVMHVGPYDDEAAVLDEMHTVFIPGNGLEMTGQHHEVYLSDVRRVEPAKLRTLLRQPVVRTASA